MKCNKDNKIKPQKWDKIYPHGTKEGDDELKFFIAIARNKKYVWRSVSAISKETGLTKERVEEIISKYYKKGIIFQHPKNEDQWGYWERVPEMLPTAHKSISKRDQDDRLNKSGIKSIVVDWASDINANDDFWMPINTSKYDEEFTKAFKELFK
jgi:hypothetical protein